MSKHQSDAAGQDKLGPDYFSYFRREVIDLLSQEDNLLSTSSSHDSRISEASSSFGDSMGPKLSHFKKEKLKALLRQSAVVLSEEVNEVFSGKDNWVTTFQAVELNLTWGLLFA